MDIWAIPNIPKLIPFPIDIGIAKVDGTMVLGTSRREFL